MVVLPKLYRATSQVQSKAFPGWDRASTVVLAFWVAVLAVDRVDFLGGEGPFVLTPFLLLTPVVLALEVVRHSSTRERLRSERGAPYLLLLSLLVVVILLSSLLALDPIMSAKRSVLLAFQAFGTLIVAGVMAGRASSPKILVSGAKIGIGLYVVFCAMEIAALFANLSEPVHFGFVSLDLWPHMYYGLVPRVSGPVIDANRGSLMMVFFLFILLRWAAPGPGRWAWTVVGSALVLLTLSRSGVLAGVMALGMAWAGSREIRVARGAVLVGSLCLALFSGWMMVDAGARSALFRLTAPLAQRLSPLERSTNEHLHLLGRGLEEATESVKRVGIGIGYGNAYLVLQDVFPGNKYGNFHSLYLTMMAESGVFALLLVAAILVCPLVVPGPWRPLIMGLVAFNVFYQTQAEPLFWFALAMAWLTPPVEKPAPEPTVLEL